MSDAGVGPEIRIGSSPEGSPLVSTAVRHWGATRGQWLGLGAVAGTALAVDQIAKLAVRSSLAADEGVRVIGPLTLRHITNSGIAFGLFSRAVPIVVLLTAFALGWMLLFFARSGARHPVLAPALGLLAGGSIANLIDRVRLGHVTDFIEFPHWPTFNLADAFITIGVVLLLGALVFGDGKASRVRT